MIKIISDSNMELKGRGYKTQYDGIACDFRLFGLKINLILEEMRISDNFPLEWVRAQ